MAQDTETRPSTAIKKTPADETKPAIERHPLADILGAYRDDPMLDAVMEEVYKRRREMEAEEAANDQDTLAA